MFGAKFKSRALSSKVQDGPPASPGRAGAGQPGMCMRSRAARGEQGRAEAQARDSPRLTRVRCACYWAGEEPGGPG